MVHGWAVIAVAFAYFGLLFAVAWYGDRVRPAWMMGAGRPYLYAFSIGVFCTSWTFFGSVGLATTTGIEFFAVYLGPILLFAFGSPLILRIIRLAKAQNFTSIADVIAARYGKRQSLAVIVSVAAVIGAIPYIALQLKAISSSVQTLLTTPEGVAPVLSAPTDLALWVALILAGFAALFGTRHLDATEHQHGLMLAIAMESVVKLVAFLAVGAYVTWGMFDGLDDLVQRAESANLVQIFEHPPRLDVWLTISVISTACIILLPRQFHVTVVENMSEREVRYASWLVPAYLVAISTFVIPVALAGMLTFADGSVAPDMFVLALPLSAGNDLITIAAFVGGFSAATAMVIVETVALSIMVSNNIAIPLLLGQRERGLGDMRRFLLIVRRASILGILILAYIYYRYSGERGLAQTGLVSFAAIAQFAPAFFGGLFWRAATSRGAIGGILVGLAVWAYTLLLPGLDTGAASYVVSEGLFGLSWLRPQSMFGVSADPLVHGVFWSLGLNTLIFVVGSLARIGSPLERLQANAFVGEQGDIMAQSFHGWHTPVEVGELQSTVARYLGETRTTQAFANFGRARHANFKRSEHADVHTLRFAEHLLASVIGTSSSRLVLSLLLQRRALSKNAAMLLLDDASAAIQYSRDLLQTALDHAEQGVAVYDRDLRLAFWNREFVRVFQCPPDFLRAGMPMDELIRRNAERGLYGPGPLDEIMAERLQRVSTPGKTFRIELYPTRRVVEIRANAMPDGGMISTYTDVTRTVEAEKALERRVDERTRELTQLNRELARAKAEADSANFSKTRFLAAASHDILQPLNAARLYVASLNESLTEAGPTGELVSNIDASLQSVEEIFTTLLDISRLDAGALTPDITTFRLGDILRQLEVEFAPLAREKNLKLRIASANVWVKSDRRLLRRLLQNLVSNAIKYTPKGRVVVGCRHRPGGRVSVEVWDTGLGIPASKQKVIFKEFQRLESGARAARGLGLGLSIVERLARVLDHTLTMRSIPGRGTMFALELPRAAAPDMERGAEPAIAKVSAPLSGPRVLCIDNEVAILEGMRLLLSGWGCKIATACDVEGALASLDEFGFPDVILADYHLDPGDGLAAVRMVRERTRSDLPAILITADRDLAIRDAARAQGLEVLHKPLRPAALRALLRQLQMIRPAAE